MIVPFELVCIPLSSFLDPFWMFIHIYLVIEISGGPEDRSLRDGMKVCQSPHFFSAVVDQCEKSLQCSLAIVGSASHAHCDARLFRSSTLMSFFYYTHLLVLCSSRH